LQEISFFLKINLTLSSPPSIFDFKTSGFPPNSFQNSSLPDSSNVITFDPFLESLILLQASEHEYFSLTFDSVGTF
jgi:hypothetical protein